jgi:hypothetical protein
MSLPRGLNTPSIQGCDKVIGVIGECRIISVTLATLIPNESPAIVNSINSSALTSSVAFDLPIF